MELPTKDLTLGGTRYQLNRFTAREGSWILAQFLPHMPGLLDREKAEKLTEKELGIGLAATFSGFSEETFRRIQDKTLAAVKRYDANNVPMPLFMADGKPIPPEPDLVEMTALTVAALVFNLHCFFAPGASATLLAVFPDLSQMSAPGSTATS